MLSFLEEYDKTYAQKLGRRTITFRVVIEHLLKNKPNDVTIVETGTINELGNWQGHGQSTLLFDALVQSVGGHLYSVDIDHKPVILLQGKISDKVTLITGNSLDFLQGFNKPIDLLYLDSFDLDHTQAGPSAMHHLFEFIAAARNLHTGSIVCVDDTWWEEDELPYGKGMVVCEIMQALKHKRITAPKELALANIQVAWVMK